MLHRFLLPLSVLVLAQLMPAQVTVVSGSGCPNATTPTWTGTPQLNTTLRIQCTPGPGMPHIVIGQSLASPITVPSSLTCANAACTLACSLMAVFTGATLNIPIPNDPVLVGQDFCVQCVDLVPSTPCVDLSRALKVTVMP